MSRTLKLAVLIAALALTACVDNNADSGLTILRNIAPATDCVIATDSVEFQASGKIQSDSTRGYLFTPVARNDLTLFEGESESAKTVFVEGARVTVGFYDADLFTAPELTAFTTAGVTRFVVPLSGSVEPSGGLATFGFEIVPPELLSAINAKLVPTATDPHPRTVLDVSVQVFGRRAGGGIDSNVFRYPVEVCLDCVKSNVGACDALPMEFMGGTGGACNLLQDGALDCCTQVGPPTELCPAVSTGTQS